MAGDTGKSVSETLILESVNPKYDKRLFIELPEEYKYRTSCAQILFWMSKQNNTKKLYTTRCQLVFFWNSMKNLLSYCGLTDSRRASDTDLPVYMYVQTSMLNFELGKI